MGKVVGKVTDAFGLTDISGTEKRAKEAAAAQREAALKGGTAAAFRPVGMTTRFGTSRFTEITDPVTGLPRVTEAGYTLSPELLALQDALFGMTGGALDYARGAQDAAAPLGGAAQSLFGLGQQYLAESPEAARQRYFDQQQALLAAPREREEQRLASSVFGRGRAGLNIGDIGQPELYSLAAARRQQDLALAAQAEQAAQQQIGFGSGLFGQGAGMLGQQYAIPTQALGPLQTYLGTIGSIEDLGQDPFRLGLQVGGMVQQGGATGGNLLSSGLSSAALTQQRGGDAASGQLTGFMNSMLGAAIGAYGMPSFGGGGGGIGQYASRMGTNFVAPGVYG
jgi:hypothetical protein